MTLPVLDRAADADRYEVISGGFDAHLFPSAANRPDDRVLDIGCGHGRTTVRAARLASSGHAVGNDVVEPVPAQARVPASAVIGSGAPIVHSLADPDRIADVLARAGFGDVAARSVETTIPIAPDAAAAADFILRWGAFRGVVDDDAVPTARAALTDGLRPFQTPDGVHLRSTAWLVHATRS